eukprot:CAMPEP_0198221448 /NCGR_PEP_ID=MMETSP1445-20131203/83794_1 /TAXON_ID=36898 /ORGANISM="Pyramimonas sp., Strain CCMP2087" /LENGTH=105 /DNA_ID=CAMNT_0043899623 /DNA_START=47 /DNA_END=364 /DNA_ORIENTATION=+
MILWGPEGLQRFDGVRVAKQKRRPGVEHGVAGHSRPLSGIPAPADASHRGQHHSCSTHYCGCHTCSDPERMEQRHGDATGVLLTQVEIIRSVLSQDRDFTECQWG